MARICAEGKVTKGHYGKAFERGFTKTVRFLMSRGAAPEIAEEMAQAAWARGWTHRGQLRDPRWIETWVNSIAINLFRNSHRSSSRRETQTELPIEPISTWAGVDAKTVLNCCRSTDRSLLKLHYFYGYTTAEIGNLVGLSSIAVRVRLLRARRFVQERLKINGSGVVVRKQDSDAEALPRAA